MGKSLTYQCLFNFIVGNRGAGKTYGSKERAIKKFLKNGSQFAYVRRYKTELADKGKYFDDILDKFPNHTFEVKGNTALIDGKPAGFFIALSTSKIKKSTAYPHVDYIIFDEFIIDKGCYHYLQDEVLQFLELYETIARTRDVIVYFLSNAITVTNPYFMYFHLNVDGKHQFTKFDDILVEFVQDEDFIEMKKNTRFGKLINGTKYASYSIDNAFLRDDDSFIEKKTGRANYYCSLRYKNDLFGIWVDYSAGKFWVSKDIDTSFKVTYSLTLADHTPNTLLLKGKSTVLKYFVENYKIGNVYFESMNIKNITYEIMRLFLL